MTAAHRQARLLGGHMARTKYFRCAAQPICAFRWTTNAACKQTPISAACLEKFIGYTILLPIDCDEPVLCWHRKSASNPGHCQVKHTISLAAFLFILWFGLSGHTEPLLLSLGIASVVFTVYLAHRMDVIDHDSHPIHHLTGLVRFWPYLMVQVIKSNIDVIGRILRPGRSISPQMVDLPLPQRSDLGRVIYANSITLTPGTVSVHLGKDFITVHALSKQAADDLGRGEMASRVPDDIEDISHTDSHR